MLLRLLELLRSRRARFVDRLVERVVAGVPRYSLAGVPELRQNVDALYGDLVAHLEEGDPTEVEARFSAVARARVEQGFEAGDFLRAVLLATPVLRETIAEAGLEADPAIGRAHAVVERVLHEVAAMAATSYADGVTRRLAAKNDELNRLNARLEAEERLLTIEVKGAAAALDTANEFNRRVVETLSSGLLVVDTKTRRVLLFTSRAEEILGIPAERALGREVHEALAGLGGFDLDELVQTVGTRGRLPLTKVALTLPSGARRSIYARGERMLDAAGAPRATVVVIDDITERELLFDSFSRYVSRDLLRRVLARSGPMGLEGERRSASILHVRLHGLAAMSETEPPEALRDALDAYFRAVVEGVTLHGGFVDKLLGDRVMAIFMGPPDPAVTATAAVRAALATTARLEIENAARTGARLTVQAGIGTGEVLLGNLGNEDRMEFTAIGRAVTIAEALAGAAAPGEVLMGARTAELLDGRFLRQEVAISAEGGVLRASTLLGEKRP